MYNRHITFGMFLIHVYYNNSLYILYYIVHCKTGIIFTKNSQFHSSGDNTIITHTSITTSSEGTFTESYYQNVLSVFDVLHAH